jgi:adenine deaminase
MGKLMRSLRALLAAVAAAQTPDVVYLNGKIVTVDPRFSIAEAIAIRQGRFTAVGKGGEIRKLAGPSTRVIDLHGKTLVPGFEDSHLHSADSTPGSAAVCSIDVLVARRSDWMSNQ